MGTKKQERLEGIRRRGSLQTKVHALMRTAFAEGCPRSELIAALANEINFIIDDKLRQFVRLRSAGDACKCGGAATPLHACPHAEELHGDGQPICNCCETCAQACADDV